MESKLKKIVLIGPVYPYKGGIAHYTAALYRELNKEYNVSLISYKLQYPKFLFKKEQKDCGNIQEKIDEAQFLLNTANPINIFRTALKIKKIKPQLLILQWWHPYFSPCNRLLQWFLKKVKVLYICHNVLPHERFLGDRRLTKLALEGGNGFITQSASDTRELRNLLPEAKYIAAVHPTYGNFNYDKISVKEARERLGISEDRQVLLFFGFVREYKGLKYLLSAMPLIASQLSDVELWVVGEFGEDRQMYVKLIEELHISPYVRLVDQYVPDREIQKYFAASDLVVIPYESATQSGIVQIAYGFGKPVVATEVGGLPDVVTHGKTGYLVRTKNERAIGDAVIRFLRKISQRNSMKIYKRKRDAFPGSV